MTTLAFPLNAFQEQMNQFLEQALPAFTDGTGTQWAPRTAIHENDNQLILELDVPGIKKEDLEIRVEKDQLLVHGERKPSANLEDYRRVEPRYGAFSRAFALPDFVNQEAITADLKDGVLRLNLPKRDETKPRQISVRVNAGETSSK